MAKPMAASFSQLTGRLCAATRKTTVFSRHGGAAVQPVLTKYSNNGAAICTMGARNGRLRSSLEMRIKAEAGSTLMVDSVMPVKLLPGTAEYGIGIHASVENDALLVITPDAHVPHLDAQTGLWTRYDLSPDSSLVSVQLADLINQAARPPSVGGRYTTRTRVHHPQPSAWAAEAQDRVCDTSALDPASYRAMDSLPFISESCSLPSVSSCGLTFSKEPSWACDWTYGRRFKGLVMGSANTNVVASVILSGKRAAGVVDKFQSVEAQPATCKALGLGGEVHLAVQCIPRAWSLGHPLFVARVGAQHREDMHRLLGHCLAPLQAELGIVPYERMIRASQTVQPCSGLYNASHFVGGFDNGKVVPPQEQGDGASIHVQHFDA